MKNGDFLTITSQNIFLPQQTVPELPEWDGIMQQPLQAIVAQVSLSNEQQCQSWYAQLNKAEQSQVQRAVQIPLTFQMRVVARYGLRLFLGQHLGIAPADVPIVYPNWQRPYLSPNDKSPIYFSLSYAKSRVWWLFSKHPIIGIDVQNYQPDILYHDIASSYYTPTECGLINQSEYGAAIFFQLWTRREALLKATGIGLHEDMRHWSVADGTQRLPINDVPLIHIDKWKNKNYFIKTFLLNREYVSIASDFDFDDVNIKKITI